MFRQAQHDTRCCGLIRAFAVTISLCFDKLPLLGKAQVGKAFSPSQCGKSHYPSRTTENSVKAKTIRSLPFSGGSLRNISKALSTSQAPEFSCRWTPLSWAVSSYIGRLYLQLTEGFPCLASRRNELNQECLCFDKLNMTENTERGLKNVCHTEPVDVCASPPSWVVKTQTGTIGIRLLALSLHPLIMPH